jgi:hypothetical protein
MKIQIQLSKITNPWERKRKTGDFFSHNTLQILQGEKPWHHFSIRFGIRRSDKIQLWPYWNSSNNSERSCYIGIWKFFIQPVWSFK